MTLDCVSVIHFTIYVSTACLHVLCKKRAISSTSISMMPLSSLSTSFTYLFHMIYIYNAVSIKKPRINVPVNEFKAGAIKFSSGPFQYIFNVVYEAANRPILIHRRDLVRALKNLQLRRFIYVPLYVKESHYTTLIQIFLNMQQCAHVHQCSMRRTKWRRQYIQCDIIIDNENYRICLYVLPDVTVRHKLGQYDPDHLLFWFTESSIDYICAQMAAPHNPTTRRNHITSPSRSLNLKQV